jgi:hypothetical protein
MTSIPLKSLFAMFHRNPNSYQFLSTVWLKMGPDQGAFLRWSSTWSNPVDILFAYHWHVLSPNKLSLSLSLFIYISLSFSIYIYMLSPNKVYMYIYIYVHADLSIIWYQQMVFLIILARMVITWNPPKKKERTPLNLDEGYVRTHYIEHVQLQKLVCLKMEHPELN